MSVLVRRSLLFGPLLDDQRQRLLVDGVAHGRAAGAMAVLHELVDVLDEHAVVLVRVVVYGPFIAAQADLSRETGDRQR